MFHQVAYLSAAASGLTDADVHDILAASHRNNAPAGISGMLLLVDQTFFQVLEGEKAAVEKTLARIAGDRRHSGIIHVLATERDERHFPEWSMGFEKFLYKDAGTTGSTTIPFDITDIAKHPTVSALNKKAPEIISFMRALYSGRHMRGAPSLG